MKTLSNNQLAACLMVTRSAYLLAAKNEPDASEAEHLTNRANELERQAEETKQIQN